MKPLLGLVSQKKLGACAMRADLGVLGRLSLSFSSEGESNTGGGLCRGNVVPSRLGASNAASLVEGIISSLPTPLSPLPQP